MFLQILLIILVVIIFLVAFLLIRTLTFPRPFIASEPVELTEVDADIVAEHLSRALQCDTVSILEDTPASRRPFYELQLRLHETYPRLHAALQLHTFNEFTLLYTWPGKNADLPAIVLMGHLDVVPADPETLEEWEYPPFSGAVADGYVWGRGALDDKGQVITILEAVESLLKQDYQPERTIYLAFSHDEETGGHEGTEKVVKWFADHEIPLGVVLDEGGQIVSGMLPGTGIPVAMVGTAEKGTATLKLVVETDTGHSAFPPRQTAVGILGRALAFLEHDQMPAHLDSLMPVLKNTAAAMPFTLQLALANLWLLGGTVKKRLEANPGTNAVIRTTTAPTILHAGDRPNVLPAKATAVVNFRLRPGDSIAAACDHVRKVVDDPRVKLEVLADWSWEASPVSEDSATSYQLLARTIRQVFDNTPVTPYLVPGATDARHYRESCDQIYRFAPLQMTQDDLPTVHGLNERVAVDALGKMVQFYIQLIQSWGEDF
jgi:carboxypeptidase PM20D1